MDTLHVKGRLFKKITNWAIASWIKSKTGCKMKVDIKDLEVINDESNAKLHLEIDAFCKSEDLDKVLTKFGL